MERKNIPNKIIVHHSASPRNKTSAHMIDEWHKERGFTKSRRGNYIGYHYIIHGDGFVYQAREDDEEGCHTIGRNLSSIGICLTGNFDTEVPSDAQIEALKKLLVELLAKYHLGAHLIFPHRYFANTSCCGERVSAQWLMDVGAEAENEILKINEEKTNMENRTFSVFTLINKEDGYSEIVTPHTFGDGYVLFAKVTSLGRDEDEATFVRFENPDKDFATMTNAVYRIEDIV